MIQLATGCLVVSEIEEKPDAVVVPPEFDWTEPLLDMLITKASPFLPVFG